MAERQQQNNKEENRDSGHLSGDQIAPGDSRHSPSILCSVEDLEDWLVRISDPSDNILDELQVLNQMGFSKS